MPIAKMFQWIDKRIQFNTPCIIKKCLLINIIVRAKFPQ
jgi:hypothetical protein